MKKGYCETISDVNRHYNKFGDIEENHGDELQAFTDTLLEHEVENTSSNVLSNSSIVIESGGFSKRFIEFLSYCGFEITKKRVGLFKKPNYVCSWRGAANDWIMSGKTLDNVVEPELMVSVSPIDPNHELYGEPYSPMRKYYFALNASTLSPDSVVNLLLYQLKFNLLKDEIYRKKIFDLVNKNYLSASGGIYVEGHLDISKDGTYGKSLDYVKWLVFNGLVVTTDDTSQHGIFWH